MQLHQDVREVLGEYVLPVSVALLMGSGLGYAGSYLNFWLHVVVLAGTVYLALVALRSFVWKAGYADRGGDFFAEVVDCGVSIIAYGIGCFSMMVFLCFYWIAGMAGTWIAWSYSSRAIAGKSVRQNPRVRG